MRLHRVLPSSAAAALVMVASLRLAAEPGAPEQAAEPGNAVAKPALVKTSPTGFKLGDITFDTTSREVRFPGWINMTEGLIEFPVTHRNGRLHEAIVATDVLPLHLETVLRLLRYSPSNEIFPEYPGVDFKNPPPIHEWPDPVFSPPKPGSHVAVFLEWDTASGPHLADLRDLIQRNKVDANGEPVGKPEYLKDFASHWVYTGTTEDLKLPVADLGGSIVAIRPEPESCINTVASDALHAGEWFADPDHLPAMNTPVRVIIRPIPPSPSATNQEPPNPKP